MKLKLAILSLILVACAEIKGSRQPLFPDGDAPDAHFTFLVTKDVRGNPLTGDLGGLEGADQICQQAALNMGFENLEFKALLSRSAPPEGIEGYPAESNAQDRISLRKRVVMLISPTEYVEILSDPEAFWNSCSTQSFSSVINRNTDFELVENSPIFSATDCEGKALHFNCAGWTNNTKGALGSDPNDWDDAEYYRHQQSLFSGAFVSNSSSEGGRIFADSFYLVPCSDEGALICISQ